MASIEALVDRQMKRRALAERAAQEQAAAGQPAPGPLRVITISRQAGSGGRKLAPLIASMLGFEFIDRQILELLIKNTGVHERLINSLDERTQSGIDLWVEGVLTRRYVDKTEYAHLLAKTINILAENGNAVMLGRGANVILGKRGGFHVRIVAPREVRIANLVNFENLSPDDARKRVETFDDERRKFYHDSFNADINNPEDYHLIINTGKVSLSTAAHTILAGWNSHLAEEAAR
jgi:cytidylate kinase